MRPRRTKESRKRAHANVDREACRSLKTLTLSITIAQKPYIIGSLGPKALKYESFDAKGKPYVLNPAPYKPFKA